MSKLLKWIVNIILLAAIVIAGGLLIPQMLGVTTFIVDDVDMETNLAKGSVTYGLEKSFKQLKSGDQVLLDGQDGKRIYRLQTIDAATGDARLKDMKSADGTEKQEVFREPVTKVLFTIPWVGYIVMAMKSTEGLIIIGLAVIFVIVLFVLAELWKRDDEGGDEDFDDEEGLPSPPVNVDVPAQILEEVSSEIASAVSSVVAKEAEGAKETAKAIDNESASYPDEPADEDLEPIEGAWADAQDREKTEMDEDDLAAQISQQLKATLEEEAKENALAMPVYSAEELLKKAQNDGDQPEVRVDDQVGVTVLDYSDIL